MLKLRKSIEATSARFDSKERSKDDKIFFQRWLCRNDLFYFARLTDHTKLIEPFHRDLCDRVSLMNWKLVQLGMMPPSQDMLPISEVVDNVKELGKEQRLYLLFRSAFKTTIITKLHTAQLLLNFPELHIAISHNTQINASDNLISVKNFFLSTALRELFPEYIPNSKEWGNQTGFSVACRKQFTMNGDSVEAIGIGTEVTGRKYHIFKNDDIVTEKSVTNEEQLRQSRDYLELHKSLFVNPSIRVEDYSGTKYHFADAYSVLQESPDVDKTIVPLLDKNGKCAVPEMFSEEGIKGLKEDAYIFNCNPYEAPIWMADGTFKPIGEIQVGDEIMGFNGYIKGKRKKLIKTKVLAINNRISSIQKVILNNRDIIRCTPDHKWFKGRINDKFRKEYDIARKGQLLVKAINIPDKKLSEQEIYDWSYIAGMIDGEGSCGWGSIAIHQSLEVNPEVCKKIRETLDRLKIEYKTYIYETHGIHKKSIHYALKSDRQFRIDLLVYGNPAKRNQIMKIFYEHSADFCKNKPKVLDIIPDGEETVYSMQTESGNYIAWGYASKNCQYQLNPEDPKKVKFTREMIQYATVIPEGLNYYLVVDPADSEEKRACYTAMKVFGVDSEDNWYWVDGLFDKIDDRQRIDEAVRLAQKWRVFEVLWENISFGRTDCRNLERRRRELKGATWQVREISASHSSKDDRILGLNDRYSRKKIFWLPTLMYYSKFEGKTIDLIEKQEYEFLGFPLVSHKDLLDAESFMLQIDLIKGDKIQEKYVSKFSHIKSPEQRGITEQFWHDWDTWKENGFATPMEAMAGDDNY